MQVYMVCWPPAGSEVLSCNEFGSFDKKALAKHLHSSFQKMLLFVVLYCRSVVFQPFLCSNPFCNPL